MKIRKNISWFKESTKLTKLLGGEELGEKIDHLSAKIEQMSTQPLDHSAFTLTNYEVLRAEIDILRDEQKMKQSAFEEMSTLIAQKDEKLKMLENDLENKENVWNGEKHLIEEKLAKMKQEHENSIEEQSACKIHLEEFKKLRDSLSGSDDEQKETEIHISY